MTERSARIRDLATRAAQLHGPARHEFLTTACGDDLDLRRDVEAHLASDETVGMGSIHAAPRDPTLRSPSDARQIGSYRIVRPIGSGGMGEVFEAEQLEPVRRRVALKLIRPGFDSKEVVARFESERQVLAMMEHPAIAKVYDAGTTDAGRPFFVMEFVPGVPITQHCDDSKLDMNARLELFLRVCDGVQHAHHKAIIHRDIKPTNVLVSTEGAEAYPKIIDFGVARATSQWPEDSPAMTQFGQIIGTPEYMSPEQAGLTAEDVDTRTDVYSLGVLLYELLTGALPFDSHMLRGASGADLRATLLGSDPPRPSTRVSHRDSAVQARKRGTTPRRLASELRGELDWITMRAIEGDRERRYVSPDALSQDLRRYLADEPVLAGPPGVAYRISKFVKRHRVAVIAASAIALALVLGLGAAVYGLLRARQAEVVATREATAAQTVSSFLVDLFEGADPDRAPGSEVTARQLLDEGVQRLDAELEGQPQVKATLLETMAESYYALGLYDTAEPLLVDALDIRENRSEDEPLELAGCLDRLSELRWWQGRYEESLELAERFLDISERELPEDDHGIADALHRVASAHSVLGRPDKAEVLHRRALAIYESAAVPDSHAIATTVHNVANDLLRQGRDADSEPYYRRSIEIERALRGESSRLATTYHVLAIACQSMGRIDEALELEETSLAMREKILGREHPHVALSLTTMGNILTENGEASRGEHHLRRAAHISWRSLGPVAPDGRWMVRSLAKNLAAQGKFDEAVAVMDSLVQEARNQVEDEGDLTSTLNVFGAILTDAGHLTRAEETLRWSLEIEERVSGRDHPYVIESLGPLARVCHLAGRPADARALFRRGLTIAETMDPDDAYRKEFQALYEEFQTAAE